MATNAVTPEHELTQRAKSFLNPYEEFRLSNNDPAVYGWVIQLKTNLYIHRKHTKTDQFIPHSVYQAMSTTALPNINFIEEWLKNARKAAEKFINKGEYQTEELIGGEYQTVKRHYNKWIYFNVKDQIMFGKINKC